MATLGEKIRQMRRQRGMTQSELGLGIVSASMMSQIESGRTRPSYALLTNIANKLDMPVEYFLDDFEDHFATSARLQLAEFWLLIGAHDQALEMLNTIDVPDVPGADYFHYRFLLARLYRIKEDYEAAVKTLEELREHALKTLDNRILFLIMKESGYVEQALGNPEGARHEWKMALSTGVSLPSSGHFSQLHFRADLAEICIQLHKISQTASAVDEGEDYLSRAHSFSESQGNFRDIAITLVEEAVTAITDDPSRAKTLVDTGVHLIHFASFVEQYVLIRCQASDTNEMSSDPWHQAARATTSLHPELFIQGEVERIERTFANGEFASVIQRAQRCFGIIGDYVQEDRELEERLEEQMIALTVILAKAMVQSGDQEGALTALQELTNGQKLAKHPIKQLECYSLLLKWAQERGDTNAISNLEYQVKTILRSAIKQPLF